MMVARGGASTEARSDGARALPVGGPRHTAGMDRSTAPIQVVFDAADPGALAEFWAAALAERGYAVPGPPGDFADWPAFLAANGVPEHRWNDASAIEAEGHPRIFFQKVPEPKTAKNRMHLDLHTADGQRDAEVERLIGLGATFLHDGRQGPYAWVTLADPEGNEFCVA